MITVDKRCGHQDCKDRDIYRMVGYCLNCGKQDILILFTSNHLAGDVDCPRCGCWNKVRPQRLAGRKEIP